MADLVEQAAGPALQWPELGSGLSAEQTVGLVETTGRAASLVRLTDPAYWGRSISDDRYLVTSPAVH